MFLGHFDFFNNFRNWESKTGPLREGRAATERGRAGYKRSEGGDEQNRRVLLREKGYKHRRRREEWSDNL